MSGELIKTELTKKDIKNAIENMALDKNEYNAFEIDNKICEYYQLDCNMFEELTENSHQFNCISDVYELINDLLRERGYTSDDMYFCKKEK